MLIGLFAIVSKFVLGNLELLAPLMHELFSSSPAGQVAPASGGQFGLAKAGQFAPA